MAPESPRSAPRRSGAGTAAAAAAAVKDGGAEGLLSPRFRSAAELAGWDEESVLLAALVVEDTPVRESRRKRRTSTSAGGGDGSTGSNIRKRRRRQPIRPVTLALDDDAKPDNEADGKNDVNQKEGEKEGEKEDKKEGEEEKKFAVVGEEEVACSGEKADPVGNLPCLDRLREELSCAICLEICFEPSTTPCGHSFCMKCLKHAAAKCGKRCPKCRQLICNSRSCHVNTVLWNTIQLLFPTEVEARRTSIASSSSNNDDVRQSLPNSSLSQSGRRTRNSSGAFSTERITAQSYVNVFLPDSTTSSNTSGSFVGSRGSTRDSNIRRGFVPASVSTRGSNRRRGFVPASELVTNRNSSRSDQSEDAALAYRLQQEEFINAFESEETQERVPQNSVSTARDNLRAIASRAVRLRARGWPF